VRKTEETAIEVSIDLDGRGECAIETGVGFFNHMLELLGRHSRIDLRVQASGDLEVDDHHLVEDAGIVLGTALRQALGEKRGINRFGSILLPMDEVLIAAAIDLSGRACLVSDYRPVREKVGELSTEMVNHFFLSLAGEAGMNLHFKILERGANEHHRIEAMFKSFARALRDAIRLDPSLEAEVPSTKGVL
jgi:imidazoleglycerol-phosphate dehydratase